MTLKQNDNGTLTFTKSKNINVDYYVVSVGRYVTVKQDDEKTSTNRVYATEKISATDADSYTSILQVLSFVDSTWVAANSSAVKGELASNVIYTLDGTSYYLISDESKGNTLDGKVGKATLISVSAYDKDGNLISSASL